MKRSTCCCFKLSSVLSSASASVIREVYGKCTTRNNVCGEESRMNEYMNEEQNIKLNLTSCKGIWPHQSVIFQIEDIIWHKFHTGSSSLVKAVSWSGTSVFTDIKVVKTSIVPSLVLLHHLYPLKPSFNYPTLADTALHCCALSTYTAHMISLMEEVESQCVWILGRLGGAAEVKLK